MTALFHLPESLQVSQASFGVTFGGRVEVRRGGREDVFTNRPDRWSSEFVVNPRRDDMGEWRRILRRAVGPVGLFYIHDITNAKPVGGARTAAAFEVVRNAGTAIRWFDVSGREYTWNLAASVDPVTWDGFPAVPSSKVVEVVTAAKSTATSVRVGGLWPTTLGVIKEGDYIQVGHWLYVCDGDCNSDENGQATVPIYPSLWRDAPVGTPVKLECAATIMRLDTDSVRWSRVAQEKRSPFTVRFIEVLPSEGVPE